MTLKPEQRDMNEFAKRVKSVLWRQESGKVKSTYDSWKSRVDFLQSSDGGAYSKQQAIVRASKEYPCLHRLFREYDIKAFDPNPESHPNIATLDAVRSDSTLAGVICENKEQTYRQSLSWAIDAAGKYQRTGQAPISCPCDAAYYLYQQAIAEPKDFLGRVGQIESKGVGESEEEKDLKRAGKRSIKELEAMLVELLGDDSH
jgi:hypothetical protein